MTALRSALPRSALAAALALALLSGCSVAPVYQGPAEQGVPEHFAAAPAGDAKAIDPASWWHSLQDARLDALVEDARRYNPDVQLALARLQQARVYEVVVAGTADPAVGVGAGGGRGSGSDATRGRLANSLRDGESSAGLKRIAYGAGFDAGWTLDLAGYYQSALEAAQADRGAAEAVRQAALVAVVADVVRAYEDMRGLELQAKVLSRSLDSADQLRLLMQERYRHGLINALDVQLAERQVATLLAEQAMLPARIEAARNTLAVLTGRFPEQLAASGSQSELPALPGDIVPGQPIDVLANRPDVRAAERSLAAATAQAGVAVARLMPTVSLGAGLGIAGQSLLQGDDRHRHLWSLGASAYWPLLDFGVLDGLSEIADLEVQARASLYRRTVLRAVAEVDTAMSTYRAEQTRLQALATAVAAGSDALELARQRYDRGLADFLNVVDAERQVFALQAQYAEAQTTALEQYADLFRALGGGWQDAAPPPPIRPPRAAVVAAFDHLFHSPARLPAAQDAAVPAPEDPAP
ncbi:MAG: efflux transporter outer membrane subunit [Pseudomonadota bacterium]|nr:efflux transporter outer membrane subunit [Pseudomonadota bacterium]